MKRLLAIILPLNILLVADAQDGSVDPTFGINGKVITNNTTVFSAVIVQPDKKVVAAGTSNNDFVLIRYLSNGSLDNSFGINGKVLSDFEDDVSIADIGIQSDGKILAVGTIWQNKTGIILARYNFDGSLDNSFGQNGFIVQNGEIERLPDGGQNQEGEKERITASALVVQNDGKITVSGTAYPGFFGSKFLLARFHSNGNPDGSFGNGGIATTNAHSPFEQYEDYSNDLAVQSDGKVVVVGTRRKRSGPQNNIFALARYNSNGTLDENFGQGGKILTYLGDYDEGASSIVIQPDGKILVAGHGSFYQFAVVRYLTTGELDESFSGDGKQTVRINSTSSRSSFVSQNGEKIIVGGITYPSDNFYGERIFAMICLNSDGNLDASFGNAGIVQDNSIQGYSANIAINNNRLYIAGTTSLNISGNNLGVGILAAYRLGEQQPSLPFVSIGDGIAYENAGVVNLPITLSEAVDRDLMLHYQTINGSASHYSNDYVREVGAVLIKKGETSINLPIRINWDTFSEPAEDFQVQLSLMFAPKDLVVLNKGNATVTILDKQKPAVSIGDAVAYESDGLVNLPITLSEAIDRDLMLHYQTINGSASHYSNDYVREIGAVLIKKGETSINLPIRINWDNLSEPTENFQVQLSLIFAPKDLAILDKGNATVTILDGNSASTSSAGLKAGSAPQQKAARVYSIKAYPNPSTNYFNIELQKGNSNATSIRITDVQGRVLELIRNVQNKNLIQLGHHYRPGIYFVEILEGTGKQVFRLIKIAP